MRSQIFVHFITEDEVKAGHGTEFGEGRAATIICTSIRSIPYTS